jgi:uncharacterized protein
VENRLYYSYGDYLKSKFGCRVYKVSVDAGFTCPNIDGSKGVGGCTFCDESGSSSLTNALGTSIADQVLKNISVRRSRYQAEKFIAYFQSYTNTYASVDRLKKVYDEALEVDPDIVGLAISTRPDCIDEQKIALIAGYKKRVPYVSIEYGMQTMHDRTLKAINRCQTHDDFLNAISLTKKYDLDYCAHIILGLPGEDREDMIATAKSLAQINIQGVKIHLLVALDNTPLAKSYLRGRWKPLDFEQYVSLICDFLEYLPSDCIIHRFGGYGHPMKVVAPKFMYQRKHEVRDRVAQLLTERGTYQGCRA